MMRYDGGEPFAGGQWEEIWESDIESPDPKSIPRVCGWNLLVKPIKPIQKIGSIILTDKTKDDVGYLVNVAKVLAKGPLCYNDEEKYGSHWCNVGDYVVYSRFTGQRIMINGVPCVMLADDQIKLVVDHPKDISTFFNITERSA